MVEAQVRDGLTPVLVRLVLREVLVEVKLPAHGLNMKSIDIFK